MYEVPEDASGFDGFGDATSGRHDDDGDDLGPLQKLRFLAGLPYSEANKKFRPGEGRGPGLMLPVAAARGNGGASASALVDIDRDVEEEKGNGPPSMPRRHRDCHGRACPPPPSAPERGGIGMCRGTHGGGGASSPDPSAGATGPESIAVVSGAVGSPAAPPSEAGPPSGVTRVDREERPPHRMQRQPTPSRQWGRDRVASESQSQATGEEPAPPVADPPSPPSGPAEAAPPPAAAAAPRRPKAVIRKENRAYVALAFGAVAATAGQPGRRGEPKGPEACQCRICDRVLPPGRLSHERIQHLFAQSCLCRARGAAPPPPAGGGLTEARDRSFAAAGAGVTPASASLSAPSCPLWSCRHCRKQIRAGTRAFRSSFTCRAASGRSAGRLPIGAG
jgi:hypothetical protein